MSVDGAASSEAVRTPHYCPHGREEVQMGKRLHDNVDGSAIA